jgi:hypothetical protein
VSLNASLSLIDIWQWGAGAFALLGALVWLFARRPVSRWAPVWFALAVAVWPLWVLIALAVLVLILTEFVREGLHDQFWKLP